MSCAVDEYDVPRRDWRFVRHVLVLTAAFTVAGCVESGETQQLPPTTRAPTTISISKAPASTTTTTTEPPLDRAFITDCVDHVLFLAFTGNADAQSRWNDVGQDKAKLREECTELSTSASERWSMERDMSQLGNFFAAAEDAEREREREHQRLEAAQRAEEERKQREAFFEALERAKVEQEAEARRQGEALVANMCGSRGGWYYYETDPIRVWLDYCNPASNGGWDTGGGDLDCADIGYEFRIDPWNDPHNLDRDGDGIACEGW